MLKVLICDAPSLAATLRSAYFRRCGVHLTTAGSPAQLLARAQMLRPDVVILVAGLLDPRAERELARRVRAHLADRHALLLIAVPPERLYLDEDFRSYDGIVALDEPELDLIRILGPLLVSSRRKHLRMPVHIPVVVSANDVDAISGRTIDLAGAAAGLLLPRAPEGEPYHVRFHRNDARSVRLGARTIWMRPIADGAVLMGVRLLGATLDALRALYDLALWEIVQEPGGNVVRLHGEICERTSFAGLIRAIGTLDTLDLGRVTRINSAGVLRWIELVRSPAIPKPLRLRRVSVPLAQQMMLVPMMMRDCIVESFYAIYECDLCDLQMLALVSSPLAREPPPCPDCSAPMLATEQPLADLDAQRRGKA